MTMAMASKAKATIREAVALKEKGNAAWKG